METLFAGFTALGTVAVAVLAIWGEGIRSAIAGPRLALSVRERGFRTPKGSGEDKWTAIYYHVEVNNKRSWSPAKAVRVMVIGIAKKRPDGSYMAEPLIAPMQLTWAYPEAHELFPTIAKRTETCDLGYLDQRDVWFILSTYIKPSTFPGRLGRNESMQVILVASAHNGESEPLTVEITWDGTWPETDGDIPKRLVVKEVG
jgi:hypothetical protein